MLVEGFKKLHIEHRIEVKDSNKTAWSKNSLFDDHYRPTLTNFSAPKNYCGKAELLRL
jgi:hypothetical protein